MSDRLAREGGTPVRTRQFPMWPVWDKSDEEALLAVLRSGHWGEISGLVVHDFEQRFAQLQGARHCIAIVNGTAALRVAFRALGLGPGDEVIVPPYTFIATASAALEIGVIPIFADINPDTFLLDPVASEAAITPRTKAIVPVHVAGCPADMDAFTALAQKHRLKLLEDAAQAPGATWRGTGIGHFGDLGTFSFQASKNLNAGEGGAIVTDDDALAETVWSLHNVGRTRAGAWYQHDILGGNERLTEFQAALLRTQMQRLPEQMARRDASAAYLDQDLVTIEGIRPLYRDPRVTSHAHHLYIFRYDAAAFGGMTRESFLSALQAEGIPCSAGYTSLVSSKAIQSDVVRWQRLLGRTDNPLAVSIPHAEQACATGIWLPQNVLLGSEEDVADVVRAVRKIQRHAQSRVNV